MNDRASLSRVRSRRRSSIAFAAFIPCLSALLLPFGAPGLVPPCIRHLFRPFTAGDWHAVPRLVLAKQRGAASIFETRCMGLIGNFSISATPRLNRFRDDGLDATIIDMDRSEERSCRERVCQ